VIEAAVEARAFGYPGKIQDVSEALAALQTTDTRYGYMVLSALTANEAVRKNFLDMGTQDGVSLFYFTKPVNGDKLTEETEKALAPFGRVELLVAAGDAIGEGMTSDLFVFAVTPAAQQAESAISVILDGLVEAAVCDEVSDVSDDQVSKLVEEAIKFLNQEQEQEQEQPEGSEEEDDKGEDKDDEEDADDDDADADEDDDKEAEGDDEKSDDKA
jgi:type II secretory ATPase GspE/PulE/Tfp pilus assembly ATPase PilB-like protein